MNCSSSILKKLAVLLVAIAPIQLMAQETTSEEPAPAKEYMKNTFENGVVINNQTIENPSKKSLDFMIQHRFGVMEDEKNLYGLYAPANIRLGLTYGICDRFSLGVGATKNKMTYDFQAKYNILKQTKGKGMPVSVTYFLDVAKSANPSSSFLDQEGKFKKAYQFSFFSELMVAKKFKNNVSAQLAGTYSHYNIIDSVYGQHDFYGASFVGRYKFSPQSSIVLDVDYLINVSDLNEDTKPKPNLGIGYEVSTGSHQFQIFICSADAILAHDNKVFNHNDFFKKEFLIGFNITRAWGF